MSRRAIQAIVLTVFGLVLMLTNPWFSFIDDEVNVVVTATQPVAYTIALFVTGGGQHEHPPLSDILLHYWLRLTNSNFNWLRFPAIVFYLAGLWVLAETAYELTGRDRAAYAVLALGVLWPYGFHFGRLAIWYSFSLFLVALLTYQRVRLEPDWKLRRIAGFALAALALVYTNYFGWALIACLFLDLVISAGFKKRAMAALAVIATVLLTAYVPIMRVFAGAVQNRLPVAGHSALSRALHAGFTLYAAFVSESVAPWVWALSIPAAVAIAVVIVFVLWRNSTFGRRFFLYFLALMLLMSLLNIQNTKRLLLISCWLLLPIATSLVDIRRTRPLALALVVIAAIGWTGIISRRFYAAPHFIEPWGQVAHEAATVVKSGGEVISNSGPLFFYLSYALRGPRQSGPNWEDKIDDRVFSFGRWVGSGNPAKSGIMLVRGTAFGDDAPGSQMQDLEEWLDSGCRVSRITRLLPDPGYEWKRRFFPDAGQLPWRIEVRMYDCATAAH